MTGEPKPLPLDDLSVPEKIIRLQDMWDEIARSPREVEITAAQREEAERRLLRHESEPGACSTWDSIRRRLEREP